MRAASSRDRIALSAIAITSGGTSAASRSPTPRSSSKVPRSRAFTPTICAPMLSARSSSALVVGLDEHGQAEPAGELVQIGEDDVVGDRGDDEQDRVGADRAGLVHLDLVDDEVLAQHRELAGVPGAMEVVDRAAEVRTVGEDREAAAPPSA